MQKAAKRRRRRRVPWPPADSTDSIAVVTRISLTVPWAGMKRAAAKIAAQPAHAQTQAHAQAQAQPRAGLWLAKTEPEEFSFADLQRKGAEPWTGARCARSSRLRAAVRCGAHPSPLNWRIDSYHAPRTRTQEFGTSGPPSTCGAWRVATASSCTTPASRRCASARTRKRERRMDVA
jgi:hypothetical protein